MENNTNVFFRLFAYVNLAIFIFFTLIANSVEGNVDYKSFDLDSSPKDLVWCGSTRDTVFVLTEKNSLYRSDDKGFSFKNMNDVMTNTGKDQLESNENEIGKVSEILLSPVDKNLVIFLGTHGINWVSQDCGRRIDGMNHGRKIQEFIFHPTERTWVLASAYTICDDFVDEPCKNFKELFVTRDLGNTWNLLLSYVVQFNWGVTSNKHINNGIPKERILASYDPKGKGDQKHIGWNYKIDLIYSDDFFKSKRVAAHKGNKFLLTENYLYVAQVADQEFQEVLLLVSDSNLKVYNFEPIILNHNNKFREHSYTFLDSSEGVIFLHINHFGETSEFGHVYVSDFTGTKFSLALPYNIRSADNQCDFDRINGLEGIYISNSIDEEFMEENFEEIQKEELEKDSMSDKRKKNSEIKHIKNYVKTKISFNKGGSWEEIKAPNRDVNGKLYDCESDCFLNLYGVSGSYAPFYSVDSASGLIMANGNVGQYLSNDVDEISTFLSRDGGFTWFEVRKGSHIYEIGDHGALIVIANDQHPTDMVQYSWDEGLTWQDLRITNDKIMIKNIIIEPSSTSLHFVVYGESTTVKGKKRGVVIALNFSSLNEKRCANPEEPDSPNSDYEKWSPSDHRDGHNCLLGKKYIYVRKKRESECYNGQDFERKSLIEYCTCTNYDYECDEGFKRPNHSEVCVPINSETHKIPIEGEVHQPPANCSGYYSISKGYRKIPGNQCINGVKYDPIIVPCPYSGFFSSLGVIFFVLILAVLFGLIFLVFNNTFVEKYDDHLPKFSNNVNSKNKQPSYGNIVGFF